MNATELWHATLDELRLQLAQATFDTWLRPSRADYWREMRNAFRPVKQERELIVWDEEDVQVLALMRDHIAREHERIVGQLRQETALDELSSREQGKVYAEFVSTRPAPQTFFLHLARRGELTIEKLRRVLQNPDRARKIAADWGVIDDCSAQRDRQIADLTENRRNTTKIELDTFDFRGII
jgi:hypothetical protein